ncbi:hypothetical protein FQN60_013189, partial [Etheostoma spectabile]
MEQRSLLEMDRSMCSCTSAPHPCNCLASTSLQ